MVVSSATQVVRRLVLKNTSDEQSYEKIFKTVTSSLYTSYINSAHVSLVNSIILQADHVIGFDFPEYDGILNGNLDPKEKFLQFTQLIKSRINRDKSTIIKFLEILLNLDEFNCASTKIKSLILKEFSDLVDIEEVDIFSPVISQSEHLIKPLESTRPRKRSPTAKLTDKIRKYPKSTGFIVTFVLSLILLSMFWKPIIALLHAWLIVSGSGEAASNESSTSLPSTNITTPLAKANSFVANDITTNFNVSLARSVISQNRSILTSTDVESKILHKYRVKATTFDEYVRKMTNIPPRHEVIVSIVLQSPLDWPSERNLNLPNSSEISKLLVDGPIAVDSLIDILSQTVNIKLLQIRNTGDKLCQRNQGQLNLVKGINKKAYLPLLQSLVLQYFTSCAEVHETLATHLEPLRELKSIIFHRSLIDDHNLVFIKRMLENNADTLKELKLAHTRISLSKPFLEDGGPLTLPKVETLRLDSIATDGKENEIPIGKFLSKIFPNLRVLYSNYGYVEWSQFPNILKCKILTKLGMGIEVPSGRTFFDVSFFKKYLPNVTAAHISLRFATCKTTSNDGPRKNEIIGWENVKHPLGEIIIRSNCKIHAIMSNTAMSMKYYKVQEYKSENGKYVFTYKSK